MGATDHEEIWILIEAGFHLSQLGAEKDKGSEYRSADKVLGMLDLMKPFCLSFCAFPNMCLLSLKCPQNQAGIPHCVFTLCLSLFELRPL